MGRKRKPFTRKRGVRDASLFVIACEGANTEPKYFKDFRHSYFIEKHPEIHVEVLAKEDDSLSAPQQVLDLADRFKKTYRLKPSDKLWVVIDRDKQSWEEKTMESIAKQCSQKEILLAVSNPCFELWLLLHHKSIESFSENFQEKLLNNKKVNQNKTFIQKYLEEVVGGYNPRNPETVDFMPYVKKAVERAKRQDIPNERWPNYLGSRVYQLIEQLLAYVENEK